VTLDENNFRAFAQHAIEKYFDKGMFVDGMLWSRIIALYEKALEKQGTHGRVIDLRTRKKAL
jgi:hypothetical protein